MEVDRDAVRILRTVRDKEAFHLDIAMGESVGEKAVSLFDFFEKARIVKLESLEFHLQRKNRQNWFEKTVGNLKLARKIGRLRPSNDTNIRGKMSVVIESRQRTKKRNALSTIGQRRSSCCFCILATRTQVKLWAFLKPLVVF